MLYLLKCSAVYWWRRTEMIWKLISSSHISFFFSLSLSLLPFTPIKRIACAIIQGYTSSFYKTSYISRTFTHRRLFQKSDSEKFISTIENSLPKLRKEFSLVANEWITVDIADGLFGAWTCTDPLTKTNKAQKITLIAVINKISSPQCGGKQPAYSYFIYCTFYRAY